MHMNVWRKMVVQLEVTLYASDLKREISVDIKLLCSQAITNYDNDKNAFIKSNWINSLSDFSVYVL